MDTKRAIYNPRIHKHPLFPSARFVLAECGGCHVKEPIYGGYLCNEPYCFGWFHKECANAPPEINHHPSHSEHPLLLTIAYQSGPCDCCGKQLLSPCYTCPTCEFRVDLICGMKPSPHAIEHPMCHNHSLVFLKKQEVEVSCEVCKESIGGRPCYSCLECHVYFHLDCIHLSKEIFHPCHPSHPIKVVPPESLTHDAKKRCYICKVRLDKVMYHCSMCNFTMCFDCTKHPPPLVVEDTKTHMHPLSFFSSDITFTCKFCGIEGWDTIPYICFKCHFVVHGKCIGLPRVININRHDHRISFTYNHHGLGRATCGVCRENVSQYYGAYCCSVCPNYTVHSRCAVALHIWNGVELEGTPERSEDVAPFKVVGHNLIRHFSHRKHTLRLLKDYYVDEFIRCEACIRPVRVGPIYSCKKCCFVLHEKCANFPVKKRLVFHPEPYTLVCDNEPVHCMVCGMLFGGFKYTVLDNAVTYSYVDVHCGSLSEPFFVENRHLHPLYFVLTKKDRYCDPCMRVPDDYILHCPTCNFYLCLYCATLPEEIRHMSDEHPLILYCGEEGNSTNWCEVCEMELLDPSKWFFTCSDCGVTLHVECVLGEFSHLKPEWLYTFRGGDYKVVLNDHNTRPFCSQCQSRCKVPIILKDNGIDDGYICSLSCLWTCLGINFG